VIELPGIPGRFTENAGSFWNARMTKPDGAQYDVPWTEI
jgi:hypothetical protein